MRLVVTCHAASTVSFYLPTLITCFLQTQPGSAPLSFRHDRFTILPSTHWMKTTFALLAPKGDPVVSVWDRRFAARSNPSTPASDGHPVGAVLELRPAVDNSQNSNIWMLRFSGTKRGCFGVLSSMGEIKIVELAQHSMKNALQVGPPNTLGGQSWTSPHYTRMTHHLQYPWYDQHHGREESSRVMAYDFMSPGSPSDGPAVLALHHTREVELLKIPTPPPHIHLTAQRACNLQRRIAASIHPSSEGRNYRG